MCLPRKLATVTREEVSYPSVSYLRVLRRPAKGVWTVKVRARDFDVYVIIVGQRRGKVSATTPWTT